MKNMKTLYININGEDIQSTENMTVVGKPDDAIVNKFYFELGKEIARGVDAPGIGEVKKKSLVTEFEAFNPDAFGSIARQWESLKVVLLGEHPEGTRKITLPEEYLNWLRYHINPAYNAIAESLAARGNAVEVSIGKIYRNAIGNLLNCIDTDERYGRFVVNDNLVDDDSAISQSVFERVGGIAFAPFEVPEVCFSCNAATATLYVDGTVLGTASGRYALVYGTHSLKATAEGYEDYTGSLDVGGGRQSFGIAMRSKEDQPLTFTVKGVSFRMMPVEGGTFTMGATAEQGGDAWEDEKFTHSVTLSSYYMGETQVTQALWQAVTGSNPSNFTGDSRRPVESVSWNGCQDFITKLNQLCASQLNGKRFALPTEAEWEYAARGGKKSRGYKYSGSNTIGDVAWYYGNSGDTTHAVGTKQANELGLYDMSGNVDELCQDWYNSSYYSSSPQNNPAGPASGKYRVDRGGSWSYYARNCRVSDRGSYSPGSTYDSLGLRLSLR